MPDEDVEQQAQPTPSPRGEEPVAPLFLPVGSVRALIALGTLGTLWAIVATGKFAAESFAATESLRYLQLAAILVLSYYFAQRGAPKQAPAEAGSAGWAPLFLPRGTIRTIIVCGFIGVTVQLFRMHWLDVDDLLSAPGPQSDMALFLLCIHAFFLGKILDGVGKRTFARWFEAGARAAFGHVRAVAALAVVATFCTFLLLGKEMPSAMNGIYLFAVGFYLGSR